MVGVCAFRSAGAYACIGDDLMIPKTGSTVCIRKAYAARPALIFSLCAMACIGVAVAGNGDGSLWRARQPGWCSSLATAISGSMSTSSHALMFFSLQ